MTTNSAPASNRYVRCAAPGCIQSPRKFSRYCRHHYAKLERTRSLNGRVVTKGELKANRADCLEFLRRNAGHPAVSAAVKYMADLLAPTKRAGFLQREFDRLREAGLLTLQEMADALHISPTRVKIWNRHGLIRGHAYSDKNECLYEPPGDDPPRKAMGVKLSERKLAVPLQLHDGGVV